MSDNRLNELQMKLAQLERQLETEMRQRGFDPAQAENVALTSALAKLYAERAEVRAQLDELRANEETPKMPSETERIQDQLRRAFAGSAWHGPSVLELLANVTAREAAARPIAAAHSIWEITLHIAAWEKVALRRLSGDPAEIPDEEDWPAVTDTGDAAWQRTIADLKENHQKLYEAIAAIAEPRLDEPILPGKSSVYVTLHGAIQHDLYHAGQIAILKKA